jgi:YbbR domain-containing protein
MDKFLQNNTIVKGLAFILALMLWMIVSLDDQPGSPIQEGHLSIDNVRVEAIYDEELYEIMEMDYETVQVILSGRRALLNLNMLRGEPYRVYVDLTGFGEGRHRVMLQNDGFPSELRVDVIPRFVQIVIEKKEPKAFPIELEVTGQPKEGYTMENTVLSIDQVYVIAPSSILSRVEKVKGFINVENRDETFVSNVTLRAYDKQGTELEVEMSPNVVDVEVQIKSPSKKVPFRIELENKPPDGLSFVSIQSDQTEIEISSSPEVLEKIKEITTNIDLAKINSSQVISYTIPLDKDWQEVSPTQVNLDVKVGPTQQRTINNIPIEVKGLPTGFEIEFIDPVNGRLNIDLFGSREKLEQVRSVELQPTIDVSELSEGQHSVTLNVNIPEHIQSTLSKDTIRIEIRPIGSVEETTAESTEEEVGGE